MMENPAVIAAFKESFMQRLLPLITGITLVSLLPLFPFPIRADDALLLDRLLQRQQNHERQQRFQATYPPVLSLTPTVPALPFKAVGCFNIHTLQLTLPRPFLALLEQQNHSPTHWLKSHWSWLLKILDHCAGHCMGEVEIQSLLQQLSQQLLQRGLITSRLVIPPQDLSTGVLSLLLLPGVISRITWVNAPLSRCGLSLLPLSVGQLLTLQDLELTLEQILQSCNQHAQLHLVADHALGGSEVVIKTQPGRAWQSVAGLTGSSSGARELQWEFALTAYHPWGIAHQLQIRYRAPLSSQRAGRREQHLELHYLLPWRYTRHQLSATLHRCHQELPTTPRRLLWQQQAIQWQWQVERLLYRNQQHQLSLRAGIGQQQQYNTLNHCLIRVQERHNSSIEYGVHYRHFWRAAQLDLLLLERRGVPWFGAMADFTPAVTAATFFYRLQRVEGALLLPFKLGRRYYHYFSLLHLQQTPHRLYAAEQLSLGGPASVRGFNEHTRCRADNGFYWRQELATGVRSAHSLPNAIAAYPSHCLLFLGLDYGRVTGAQSPGPHTQQRLGAVLGLRGSLKLSKHQLTYETTLAWPWYQTSSRHSRPATLSFSAQLHFNQCS